MSARMFVIDSPDSLNVVESGENITSPEITVKTTTRKRKVTS